MEEVLEGCEEGGHGGQRRRREESRSSSSPFLVLVTEVAVLPEEI